MNPHDDGISMDTYVDWLIDTGYPITRVPEYADWLARFEIGTAERCPRRSARHLCCRCCRLPAAPTPINGSMAPTDRFRRQCRTTRSDQTKTSRTSPHQ